jgi:hypothetical protein
MTSSCMTEEELAGWNHLNWQARTRLVHSTPCEDCTAEFSAMMRALLRCNGFPGPQRYCDRCLRWWPDDPQHWRPWARGNRVNLACLVCRRRRQARSTYLRVRRDPVRWAIRKAGQRDRDAIRMSNLAIRARKNALDRDRKRVKYQTNSVFREMVLARNRAARAKP